MLITLEGIEGSGKSTLAKNLASKISTELKREVILTREPGGTEFGKSIRSLLLDRRDLKLDPIAETLLFAADRAQHVEELILPELKKGSFVISDRYFHSTLAYQGYGRGIDLKLLNNICEIATGGKSPDLVLLLDLPAEKGLARAKSRAEQSTEQWTKFEDEEINFHKRIRTGFLELAKKSPDIFAILNAELSPEALLESSWKEIKAKLK
jgi:dTMP kinase